MSDTDFRVRLESSRASQDRTSRARVESDPSMFDSIEQICYS